MFNYNVSILHQNKVEIFVKRQLFNLINTIDNRFFTIFATDYN